MIVAKLKESKIPLLFFIGAILFRIILLHFRYAIIFDEVNYLKLGIYGAQKGFQYTLHPFWPPMYPLILGLFAKVFGHYELMARLITLLFQSVIIFPLYYITNQQFGRKAANSASFLWAFSPMIAFFSTNIFTESLYTLLIFYSVYLGWSILNRKRQWSASILLGLLLGMAYLTRPEGIGFLVVFGFILLIMIGFQLIKNRKIDFQLIITGLLILVVFITVATPYLLYLKKETGTWTISGKMESQKQGEAYALQRTDGENDRFRMVIDENKPILIDQVWHQGTFVRNQKEAEAPTVHVSKSLLIKKIAINLHQIWKDSLPRILTPFVFVLVILGLFAHPWQKEQWLFNLYLLSFLGFFILVLIPAFHITDRYFYPLLPLFFIWIGSGFCHFHDWLSKSLDHVCLNFTPLKQKALIRLIITIIFLCGIFIPQLSPVLKRNAGAIDLYADPIEHKEVAAWLMQYDKDARIMSVFHPVDFYLENYDIRKTVSLPDDSLSKVLLYARKNQATYMLLDERYKLYFPKIDYLLNETEYPEELTLLYQWKKIKGMKVLLFKIEDRTESEQE